MSQFDAIVTDSVIHLIPADDRKLAAKLARDLVPGGLLIATLPDDCRRNAALLLQRRFWRSTPSAFDRLALSLARRVHPDEPAAVLEDRIGYLRVLPERVHGPHLTSVMRSAGLDEVEAGPWPGASLFKLRHRLVVWRRTPG
jgi:trans-aconitate 2-methyltransferase